MKSSPNLIERILSHSAHVAFPRDLFGTDALQGLMGLSALERGMPFHVHSFSGHLDKSVGVASIETLIREPLPMIHQVYQTYLNPDPASLDGSLPVSMRQIRARDEEEKLFLWPAGYLLVTHNPGSGRLEIDMASFELVEIQQVRERLVPLILNQKTAQVKVVLAQEDGPGSVSIGAGGVPLVRENYTPAVLAAFDHIVDDLKSASPCGRLSIFTGPAGTGKTYALEGIVHAVPHARYLLIPPTLIAGLLEPSLLSVLLNSRDEGLDDAPTILIIEDGDECLVPRDGNNLPAIASLLNLSEGLIGRRLDIRVLATSNADHTKIDSALSRPGRLCREVDFQPLTQEQAQQAFLNLVPAAVGAHPKHLPNWEALSRSDSGVGFASGGRQSMGVSLAMIYQQVREGQVTKTRHTPQEGLI